MDATTVRASSRSTSLRPRFLCVICRSDFSKASKLHRHISKHHEKSKIKYTCKYCQRVFKNHFKYERHINETHRCLHCYYETSSSEYLAAHIKNHSPSNESSNIQLGYGSVKPFIEIKAFNGFLRTYRHRYKTNEQGPISCIDYLESVRNQLKTIYTKNLVETSHIKTQISIYCEFVRHDELEISEPERCYEYINSHMSILLNMHFFSTLLGEVASQISDFVEIFEQNGSGWQLEQILGSDIRIAEFEPFSAGCFVQLPPPIKNKKATITVNHSGQDCFKWAFLSIAHYDSVNSHHRDRKSNYEHFEKLYNFKGIKYPAAISDIIRFEKNNIDKGFCINVFGIGEKNVVTIEHVSKLIKDKSRKKIDILIYKDHSDAIGHYFGISSINRLLGKQNNHRRFLCYNCLQKFTSEKKLDRHQELCFEFKTQITTMPEAIDENFKPQICFENFDHKLKYSYVIYADFEALPVEMLKVNKKTTSYQKHEPSGYCFVVINHCQELVDKEVYRGEDCIAKFF